MGVVRRAASSRAISSTVGCDLGIGVTSAMFRE